MAKRSQKRRPQPPAKRPAEDSLSWDELAELEDTLDFLENDDAEAVATLAAYVERIVSALERLAPPAPAQPDFDEADAFVWHAEGKRFAPVAHVNRVEMSLLKGI